MIPNRPSSSSQLKRVEPIDTEAPTQPINLMELILIEMKGVSADLKEIKQTLSDHNERFEKISGQVNLAGNLSADAIQMSEETLIIVRRIDQNLTGVFELAKTGYDMAAALKSGNKTDPPLKFSQSEPDSSPMIEVEGWKVYGTGN
jgi:hypothetical protein